jgi:hypothetical protein
VELPHEELAASFAHRAHLQEARGRQQHLQQFTAPCLAISEHLKNFKPEKHPIAMEAR